MVLSNYWLPQAEGLIRGLVPSLSAFTCEVFSNLLRDKLTLDVIRVNVQAVRGKRVSDLVEFAHLLVYWSGYRVIIVLKIDSIPLH
jgi:hypothetical protein